MQCSDIGSIPTTMSTTIIYHAKHLNNRDANVTLSLISNPRHSNHNPDNGSNIDNLCHNDNGSYIDLDINNLCVYPLLWWLSPSEARACGVSPPAGDE